MIVTEAYNPAGELVGYRLEDLAPGLPDQTFTPDEWAEVAATPPTEHAAKALEIVARKADSSALAEPAVVEPVADAQPAEAPAASAEG